MKNSQPAGGAACVKVSEKTGFINTCFLNVPVNTMGGIEAWVGNCWRIFKKKIDSFYRGTQWICHFLTHV